MALANFLGIKKFGQGIASAYRTITGQVQQDVNRQIDTSAQVGKLLYAARQEKDPNKKTRLLQLAKSFGTGESPQQIDPGLNLTNKEILGSAANTALNVALPGAFKGGKLAVIGKNAALGAAFGAASGLEKNRNLSGIAGSATGGAVIGAGIGVAGIGAKALKDFIGTKVPQAIMDRAVKPALADLRKNVKFGTKTLSQELLDEGVKGGPKKLLQIADTRRNQFETELQDVLNNPLYKDVRISRDQIKPYLEELIASKKEIPGLSGDVNRIEGVWKSMPEKLTLSEANTMKRRIYRELGDVSYKLDARLSAKAGVLKNIARGLKTEIENSTGTTAVRDLNRKISIYLKLETSMVDQLAREMKNNKLGLTDAILLAGGGPTSALALLRHLGQGTETYIAQGLKGVGNALSSPVAQGVKGLARRGTFNLP